jgi:hypothetical protein
MLVEERTPDVRVICHRTPLFLNETDSIEKTDKRRHYRGKSENIMLGVF